jgi:DNA-binding response OmpR family regulator
VTLRGQVSGSRSSNPALDDALASKGRVLVVEDHPDTQAVVAEYLTERGFEVTVASDGQTAIRLLHETRPDLMYLDMNLPHISGYDVCEQIRASSELRAMGIVMVSAQSSINVEAFCLEAGADAFLAKPFELESLADLVAQIVAGKVNR